MAGLAALADHDHPLKRHISKYKHFHFSCAKNYTYFCFTQISHHYTGLPPRLLASIRRHSPAQQEPIRGPCHISASSKSAAEARAQPKQERSRSKSAAQARAQPKPERSPRPKVRLRHEPRSSSGAWQLTVAERAEISRPRHTVTAAAAADAPAT
jgi:hypothetical protein